MVKQRLLTHLSSSLLAATSLLPERLSPPTIQVVGDVYLDILAKVEELPEWDGRVHPVELMEQRMLWMCPPRPSLAAAAVGSGGGRAGGRVAPSGIWTAAGAAAAPAAPLPCSACLIRSSAAKAS